MSETRSDTKSEKMNSIIKTGSSMNTRCLYPAPVYPAPVPIASEKVKRVPCMPACKALSALLPSTTLPFLLVPILLEMSILQTQILRMNRKACQQNCPLPFRNAPWPRPETRDIPVVTCRKVRPRFLRRHAPVDPPDPRSDRPFREIPVSCKLGLTERLPKFPLAASNRVTPFKRLRPCRKEVDILLTRSMKMGVKLDRTEAKEVTIFPLMVTARTAMPLNQSSCGMSNFPFGFRDC
jgi:hypothetical protein